MLDDKRLLITGVVNADSIAFAIARRARSLGAEVALSAPPRDLERAEAAAELLGCDVLTLDVNDAAGWASVEADLRQRWGRLDGAVHAVAYAPQDALDGDFLTFRPDGLNLAFHTSVTSYASLAALVAHLAPPSGGSVVGLDFDPSAAWPTYNWMGVCKAALEAASRYVARDLGPAGIRSNLVAAGPLVTRAASAIPGFDRLLDAWDRQSPLPWVPTDPEPVADATCFLLSDLARAISGEVLHVDGGFHAMAADLRRPDQAGASMAAPPVAAASSIATADHPAAPAAVAG